MRRDSLGEKSALMCFLMGERLNEEVMEVSCGEVLE